MSTTATDSETRATTLSPCPFCGGDAVIRVGPVPKRYGVFCNNARDCGTWMDLRAESPEAAAEAWNRRIPHRVLSPQPAEPPKQRGAVTLECCHCGNGTSGRWEIGGRVVCSDCYKTAPPPAVPPKQPAKDDGGPYELDDLGLAIIPGAPERSRAEKIVTVIWQP